MNLDDPGEPQVPTRVLLRERAGREGHRQVGCEEGPRGQAGVAGERGRRARTHREAAGKGKKTVLTTASL